MDILFTPTQLNRTLTALNLPAEDVTIIRDPALTPGSVTTLTIDGGSLVRSIFGSSGSDSVYLARDSRATGTIDLGGGNDFLYLTASAAIALPGFAAPAGALIGGAGYDQLKIDLMNGLGFDGSTTSGFESLWINLPASATSGGSATVSNLAGFTQFVIDSREAHTTYFGPKSAATVTFTNVNLPTTELTHYNTTARLIFESSVVLGSFRSVPTPGSWWERQYQVNITSAATINGDVLLSPGDDYFDGRNGTVTGRIIGNGGTDRIWGGNNNDDIVGGAEIYGMGGNDRLQGAQLYGGEGDDTLIGGDLMDGGAGSDRFESAGRREIAVVTYGAATAGIGFDMLNPNAGLGDALGDTFIDIMTIKGSAFADAMRGDNSTNWLYGENGTDTIEGRGGDDKLWGGAGNDTLSGGDGNDVLNGGDGVDALDGGAGYDFVAYSEATDAVIVDLRNSAANGGAALGETLTGIEAVVGGRYGDTLRGDNGNNWLEGGEGADLLEGFDGDDTLLGGSGANYIYGGSGNDFIITRDGGSYVEAGSGNDTISIGYDIEKVNGVGSPPVAGAIYVDGGDGFDFISYAGFLGAVVNLTNPALNAGAAQGDTLIGIEGIIGSEQSDQLTGNAADNWIYGGSTVPSYFGDTINGMDGNDFLFGSGGSDTINGGNGNDAIYGFAGNNQLFGGDGNDVLFGDWGYETIDGGEGDDHIIPGVGKDVLIGGDGFDFVHYVGVGLGLTVDLVNTAGNNADAEGDTFSGIEGLVTTNFDDLVLGNSAGNWIYGNAGNDFIYGREGNDYLIGGAGTDTLYGGSGTDVLYGESGADRFVLQNGTGIDYVMDFSLNGGDAVFVDSVAFGITSFAQMQSRMVQSGNDTIIGMNGDSIMVLVGVTPAQLNASHFLFG